MYAFARSGGAVDWDQHVANINSFSYFKCKKNMKRIGIRYFGATPVEPHLNGTVSILNSERIITTAKCTIILLTWSACWSHSTQIYSLMSACQTGANAIHAFLKKKQLINYLYYVCIVFAIRCISIYQKMATEFISSHETMLFTTNLICKMWIAQPKTISGLFCDRITKITI